MRKAALITGIIFAVIVASGALMKLADIPGGGLLLVLGTGSFVLFAFPLQLIYNIKRNKSGLRRAAHVVGLFAVWTVLLGLLYKAQSWTGAHVVLMDGSVLMLVFGILFFVSARRAEVQTDWFPGFTITILVVMASLGLAWAETSADKVPLDEQNTVYQSRKDECRELLGRSEKLVAELNSDGMWDRNDTMALLLQSQTLQVLEQIEMVKTGLMYEAALQVDADPNDGQIHNAGDIHVTTMFMLGTDVEHPSGKGMEVYDQLKHYREDILAESVPFAVPIVEGTESKEQWVKDNFYHATVLEALTRLTNTEIAIANSLLAALEKEAYKE